MASASSKAQLREEVAGWNPGQIWQAPTQTQRLLDSAFRRLCFGFAASRSCSIAWLVLQIALRAVPAIRQYGLGFIYGTTWDPNKAQYGILPEIWGTLYTSLLALVIGTAFGVAAAIFLSEGYLGESVFKILKRDQSAPASGLGQLPERLELLLKNLIELLAAIPSVVYGLWGLFVVIPLIRPLATGCTRNLAGSRFFATDLSGPGVLPAVFVLSIMILPTITAISRDALVSVPPKLRMAAYGLGATRWEAILGGHSARPPRAASSAGSCSALGARSAKPWRWRCSSATPTRSACRCFRRRIRWPRCWPTTFPEAGAKRSAC